MSSKRSEILKAGEKAVDELIKVLNSPIITNGEDDISADKMRAAAAAKRLAFEDALFMQDKIDDERNAGEKSEIERKAEEIPISFAESRAKSK